MTLVEGTRAMGTSVQRVIFATDAAQPATARPFRRITPNELPEGSSEVSIRLFRTMCPYRLGFSPGLWTALRREIPTADLVTIHSLNLFPQYAAFSIALRAGVPYIVTPHGALDPWLADRSRVAKAITYRTWQHRMLSRAAAIHFTTEEEGVRASNLNVATPRFVIPNGVDISRFADGTSDKLFRTKRLNGYEGPVVLFLGRVARKKGIDLLIRGFARATPNRDSLLVVAGPDDESLTPELSRVAAAAGVRDRVRFVGPVYGAEQLSALAAADVWALASHTENFGNAVIEAMAAGCPVLVSTEVNLAGQIRRAEAGLVTALSVDQIADGLRSLLENRRQRSILGERARLFAKGFDWSLVAPQLVRAFTEIAQRRVPSGSELRQSRCPVSVSRRP